MLLSLRGLKVPCFVDNTILIKAFVEEHPRFLEEFEGPKSDSLSTSTQLLWVTTAYCIDTVLICAPLCHNHHPHHPITQHVNSCMLRIEDEFSKEILKLLTSYSQATN